MYGACCQLEHLIKFKSGEYHIGPPCAKAFETVTSILAIGVSHDLKLAPKALQKGNEEKLIQSSVAVE